VQPCDAGIIRAFKAIYRKIFLLSVVDDLYDGNVRPDLFKIDQKMAMDFAVAAWDEVSTKTIVNCWGHAGIVPGVKRAVLTPATEMSELSKAMQQLTVAAKDYSLALDVPTADEYMDNGETDEFALVGYMSIDEICDYVSYIDEDDEVEIIV